MLMIEHYTLKDRCGYREKRLWERLRRNSYFIILRVLPYVGYITILLNDYP